MTLAMLLAVKTVVEAATKVLENTLPLTAV